MTLCLIAEPMGLPTLIADTLVSVKKANGEYDYGSPLSFEEEFPPIYRLIVLQLRNLHQKIYALNNSSAFACSGNAREIDNFLQTAEKTMQSEPDFVGPAPLALAEICRLADQFGGISVVGFWAPPAVNGDRIVESMFREEKVYKSSFGEIAYIGTGSEIFLRTIKNFESQPFIQSLVTDKQALEFVFELNNVISNAGFDQASAMNEQQQSPPTWGGVFDILIRDYGAGGWSWNAPTTHLFCEAIHHPEADEWIISQVPIFIEPRSQDAIVNAGVLTASGPSVHKIPIKRFDIGPRICCTLQHDHRVAVVHVRTIRDRVGRVGRGIIKRYRILDDAQSEAPAAIAATLSLNDKALRDIKEFYVRSFI